MASLEPKTVLRRSERIRLEVLSSGEVRIEAAHAGGRSFAGGPHTLAVLDAFTRPRTLQSALDELQPRAAGAHGWVEMMSTIEALFAAGLLVDPEAEGPTLDREPAGFDSAAIHVAMLEDRARTAAFLSAIAEVVRPGDVVVDVGTGTGVLAVAAARAGARTVYAVEARRIGETARRLFAANGVADRVRLVEGWSTGVALPEKGDVLVCELLGNDPFGERVLEVFADARRRLLRPGARLVPRRIAVQAWALEVPPSAVAHRTFTEETARRWRRWYGIDFSPLVDVARRSPMTVMHVNPYRARRWPRLADPVIVADVDLRRAVGHPIRSVRNVVASRAGVLRGVLLSFSAELSPRTVLDTAPQRVRRDNHWHSSLWLPADPPVVRAGDRIRIDYRHGADGTDLSVRAMASGKSSPSPPRRRKW